MNKRFTGVIFIFISALLLISRYITAAIAASERYFEVTLDDTILLLAASIVCVVVGALYLIFAERSKEK